MRMVGTRSHFLHSIEETFLTLHLKIVDFVEIILVHQTKSSSSVVDVFRQAFPEARDVQETCRGQQTLCH